MDTVIQSVLASGTIRKDTVIIAGISGGPDSLCLLHVLNSIRKEYRLTILPIHINHKLRKKADAEQKHVEKICKGMGLTCGSVEIDVRVFAEETGMGEEEAGRTARYDTFLQIAEETEKQGYAKDKIVIAVAHNADDQSETILQHILRGTGLRGLAGMAPVRQDESGYCIIRPLLGVTRAEIEAYIAETGLKPNIDESNQDPKYQRNRIRLELIPLLEEQYNPNIRSGLRKLGSIAALDNNYMDQAAGTVFEQAASYDTVRGAILLDAEVLSGQHPAILRRVISITLQAAGMEADISYELIHEVLAVLFSDTPSARITLPAGIVAEREYRKLVFRSAGLTGPKPDPAERFRLIRTIVDREEFRAPVNHAYAAFDFDSFGRTYPGQAGKIELRTRQEKDRIAIGKGRHQKIQDYLVDAKVPRNLRDEILMVAVGNEILWVLPHDALPTAEQRAKGKFSQNYQVTDRTKEVLLLEILNRL